MVERSQPVGRLNALTGGAAVALLLLLSLGTAFAVWSKADLSAGFSTSDSGIIRFTIFQAILSALLSIIFAIPVARALARRQFKGRKIFITLLGAPFILPSIVAVFGISAVWGRSGYVNEITTAFGFSPINIYGLTGILLAHVFFNLPLATRLLLQGWLSIPAEHFRLSAQLGMSSRDVSKHLERPMLWAILPSAFLTIFLLCITSFAIALALGGGPKATTIELAIYQSLRFDFDLSKAALLAGFQFLLCAAAALLALTIAKPTQFSIGMDRPQLRWDGQDSLRKTVDVTFLICAGLFLITPLAAIVLKGFIHLPKLPSSVISASANSLLIALISASLCILMALALSRLIIGLAPKHRKVSKLVEGISFLSLAASPFVVGTGLFILIFPFFDPFKLALPITALINALMTLPFALRVILPAMQRAETYYGRLAESLAMTGWDRFKLAIWPRLRRPVGFAMGLSAALSMGDLGVITLFASPDFATLPLTMYRLMASYQMDAAGAVALLLITLSMALFWIFDRGGRIEHHTR